MQKVMKYGMVVLFIVVNSVVFKYSNIFMNALVRTLYTFHYMIVESLVIIFVNALFITMAIKYNWVKDKVVKTLLQVLSVVLMLLACYALFIKPVALQDINVTSFSYFLATSIGLNVLGILPTHVKK